PGWRHHHRGRHRLEGAPTGRDASGTRLRANGWRPNAGATGRGPLATWHDHHYEDDHDPLVPARGDDPGSTGRGVLPSPVLRHHARSVHHAAATMVHLVSD